MQALTAGDIGRAAAEARAEQEAKREAAERKQRQRQRDATARQQRRAIMVHEVQQGSREARCTHLKGTKVMCSELRWRANQGLAVYSSTRSA